MLVLTCFSKKTPLYSFVVATARFTGMAKETAATASRKRESSIALSTLTNSTCGFFFAVLHNTFSTATEGSLIFFSDSYDITDITTVMIIKTIIFFI
jgi:hypothetical protein